MFWSNVLFTLEEKNAEKGEKDNLTILPPSQNKQTEKQPKKS